MTTSHGLIREGILSDLPGIMEVINDAKKALKLTGSPQWQQGYPNEESIIVDINYKRFFVLEVNHQIIGVMAVLSYESTYDKIDGAWQNDEPYLVIHRLAVLDRVKRFGIGSRLLSYVKSIAFEKGIANIRVDTHPINIPMQSLLLKNDFVYCGIIYLNQTVDKIRYAYQWNAHNYINRVKGVGRK